MEEELNKLLHADPAAEEVMILDMVSIGDGVLRWLDKEIRDQIM